MSIRIEAPVAILFAVAGFCRAQAVPAPSTRPPVLRAYEPLGVPNGVVKTELHDFRVQTVAGWNALGLRGSGGRSLPPSRKVWNSQSLVGRLRQLSGNNLYRFTPAILFPRGTPGGSPDPTWPNRERAT